MRRYSNTAVATTITSAIDATQTTIPLAAVTGWPVAGSGDTALGRLDDEVIEYGAISGLDVTGCTRGVDGTTAAAHASGAAVVHVGSAADLEAIHTHASATTGVHGIADTAALALQTDARFTDARPPTAHATSHAEGGSDAITVAQGQVSGLGTALAALAPLDSPALTGTPSAPTAAVGNSSTLLATTEFVGAAVAAGAGPATAIRETSGPTELAVGAIGDGQMLVRSGANLVGQAVPSGGGAPAQLHISGQYYTSPGLEGATNNTTGTGNYAALAIPFEAPRQKIYDRIGMYVIAIAAGQSARLGIRSLAADGMPGALLLDAGVISLAALGKQEITISQEMEGWYWLVVSVAGAGDARFVGYNASPRGLPYAPDGTAYKMITGSGNGEALPSTPPTWTLSTSQFPAIFLRAA